MLKERTSMEEEETHVQQVWKCDREGELEGTPHLQPRTGGGHGDEAKGRPLVETCT